ncbi:MAG TPA: hypothetical protein VIN08_07920 [Ohtaekwangia sp.]|uniref:hypothetical protein n=1 Tax=Ohtaekwangia sp. TaxID=2066019 RepID=UPI002F923680
MVESLNDSTLKPLSESILRTLLYYDIFNYPLKAEEIHRFLPTNHVTARAIEYELEEMSSKGYLFQFGDLYSLQNNEAWATRRLKGNSEADKLLAVARKKGKFISSFPFVRGVLASGSLSKGYMDENSDLDFFIITKPGRLWIARMILVLYKRIFLFNSHKYFCVNYFIDTDHLEIEEKNLFTATELATVIPLCDVDLYAKLHQKNLWLRNFFPNFKLRPIDETTDTSNGIIKRAIEYIIDHAGVNWWENYCMKLSLKRWENLYQKQYTQDDFDVAFKTKKYSSKNHPNHYQRKVIELYRQKMEGFSKKFNISWKA